MRRAAIVITVLAAAAMAAAGMAYAKGGHHRPAQVKGVVESVTTDTAGHLASFVVCPNPKRHPHHQDLTVTVSDTTRYLGPHGRAVRPKDIRQGAKVRVVFEGATAAGPAATVKVRSVK